METNTFGEYVGGVGERKTSMTLDLMSLDYESYSEVSLPEVGSSVYSKHASTEVLMAAYAFNQGQIRQWDKLGGEPMPAELKEALIDPEVQKWAWNAPFEMQITDQLIAEVDIRQWRCAMVFAQHFSLPGKLEKAGPVVGLPEDQQKDRRGKALMRKFSMPRKPTKANPRNRLYPADDPEEYQAYLEYNRTDVAAERAIRNRLWKYGMPDEEWELWFVDQRINNAGLPINTRMVSNAIRVYEEALKTGLDEMRDITGLANPNSTAQLLPWIRDHGYMFDDLKKGHVTTALRYFDKKPSHWEDEQWFEYRSSNALQRVLDLRKETSRTSIKKYYALNRATDDDGNLRHVLQMNGAARTGRYAGRIFQPQNLPRPEKRFEKIQPELAKSIEELDYESLKLLYGNVFDVLASGLRPAAQAPDGYVFADADLNAIENRVLGWISGCKKILKVFEDNLDPYISFATYLYDQPYDKLWHEYKVLGQSAKRTIAKPGTLGCGYGMGPGEERTNYKTGEIEGTGLLGYAWNMGVTDFTKEDAKHSVDTFRREFKEVVTYWYDLERAAKKCIRTGLTVRHGVIEFQMKGPFLLMILPSGRPLYYVRPKLEEIETPWGAKKVQITYEGLNDRKQWVRIHTTPGKLTENADQAISRDLLVHGILLAAKRGIDIRLHVHDQIVGLVKESEAERGLKILRESMEEQPKWAKGLPLGSAGLTTKVFIKD